jgi:pimeloyl-ACP methyl ester carboxylesterase
MMNYTEETIDLGDGVFGIVSAPAPDRKKKTGVVIFNSGILHRPGPFRMHVRLARRLASLGYPTLRFDFPGVGDSLARATRPPMQIVCDVLAHAQQATGCARFVVGGICSAADLGWQLALADERVAGVLLIDGLARKGRYFLIGRLKRALRKSPGDWIDLVRRVVTRAKPTPPIETVENLRDWPAAGAERQELRTLLDRGTSLFILFGGGTSYFLHPGQFHDTYGADSRAAGVDFHYWPECDHMMYSEIDRARFIDTFAAWLGQRFPD